MIGVVPEVVTVAVTALPTRGFAEIITEEIVGGGQTNAGAVDVASKLFGDPTPGDATAPHVEPFTSESRICCGVAVLFTSSKSAAAPATCGDAIEVPLMVARVELLTPIQLEVMFTPGAKISRHVPKLLKLARTSVISVAPTVMAFGALEGESKHAFLLLFPAATATVTPSVINL